MATPRTCQDCLRLLRQQVRIRNRHASKPSRAFTSNLPRLQQVPPSQDRPTAAKNITSPSSGQQSGPSPPENLSNPYADGTSTADLQRHISGALSRPGPASSSLPWKLATKYASLGSENGQSYLIYGGTQSVLNVCASQADYTIPDSQRQGILTGEGPPKTAEGEDLGQPLPAQSSSSSSLSSTTTARSAAEPGKDNNWWLTELSLPPTFSTWSQVTCLHMYLYLVRLRASSSSPSPSSSPSSLSSSAQAASRSNQSLVGIYQRYLFEHFIHAAEEKMMLLHNMAARGTRNGYLKDLFLQWRGLLIAYDEGLVKGDAVLAAAIWRNLWKGSEAVDWVKVGVVVAYIRRSLELLADVSDEAIGHGILGKFHSVDKGDKVVVAGDAFTVAGFDLVASVVRMRSHGVGETPGEAE